MAVTKGQDLISVVIPVYKVEKYLRQCIDSVIAQTYTNMEIILVDDGSPDICPQICDEYANVDNRIKVIHKHNGGLSDARNAGIEAASGDYITFVDSDDFILSTMVETLYGLVSEYDAEMAVCANMRCFGNDTINTIKVPRRTVQVKVFSGEDKIKALVKTCEIEVMAWEKLYAKRLFKSIRFPVGKIHEDNFTAHEFVHLANKVTVTNEVGYVYRVNVASIVNQTFSLARLDAIEAGMYLLGFIEKHYPQYAIYAKAQIIYGCNLCLRTMAHAGYKDEKIFAYINELYSKYALDYLKCDGRSFAGKLQTFVTWISVRLAYYCHKILKIDVKRY